MHTKLQNQVVLGMKYGSIELWQHDMSNSHWNIRSEKKNLATKEKRSDNKTFKKKKDFYRHAEASKRPYPGGKFVTWLDSSSLSPHQSTLDSGY